MATSKNNLNHYSTNESSNEDCNEASCYQILSTGKRSYEDYRDYPVKSFRNEKPNLDEPGTREIASTSFNFLKNTLYRHQDEYSNKKSKNKELKLDEPRTIELKSDHYSVKGSTPKDTLHGHTYQLRLLMLFMQRVPDEQEFFLATEMSEAKVFDDIVLQYRGKDDNKWRHRFVQVKHRHDDKNKIGTSDLFNKKTELKKGSQLSKDTGTFINKRPESEKKSQSSKNTQNRKPYLLKKYFEAYCCIEQRYDSENVHLEEFLLCTNVGFDDEAMGYFDPAEENDPILLNFKGIKEKGLNIIKYKLNKKKEIELREKIEVNDKIKNCFPSFVEKFRFLPNYKDDILNDNIRYCLKKYLNLENVILPYGDLQKRILDWFESCNNNISEYWQSKHKKEFLESLNINIDSLMMARYSTFYVDELNNCEKVFNDISLLHEFFNHKKDKIMFIITGTPKLSIIKLNQLFNELELRQDEFILTDANKLRGNKKISTTFFAAKNYKWLAIECHNKIEVGEILDIILKTKEEKSVVIIGQKDHVLELRRSLSVNTPYFHDKNNSFKNLTTESQKRILEKQVVFQGENINLNKLINIDSGKKIIKEQTLEELLTKTVKIGNNNALVSNFLIKDYYMKRKLIQRELKLEILRNEEVLEYFLFFISDVNRNQLRALEISNERICVWEGGEIPNNGIILCTTRDSKEMFNKLREWYSENLCWLEYKNEKFLIRDFLNENEILHQHNICIEEHELNKKEILKKKTIILADGPGCGKSIFMTRVAQKLKQIMSNIWVLRINLFSYTYKPKGKKQIVKSLEDVKFKDNDINASTEFIADLLFPQKYKNEEKHFVRELFAQSLYFSKKNMKFPKVILLFDGFDEISPEFKEQTLTLLQALQNSNITQMWISTRNHEEHNLQVALNSSSFFLKPLNMNEKIDFLQKLWKYNLVHFDDVEPKPGSDDIIKYLTEITNNICNCNDESIRSSFRDFPKHLLLTSSASKIQKLISKIDFSGIAESLICDFEYTPKDIISEFTANILLLKMVGEIIAFNKFSSLDNLDIFSLHEDFIKYKFTVFDDDKEAAAKHPTGREMFKTYLKYLTTVHQETAFQILFPQHDNIQFTEVADKVALSRAGLLVIHNDRLEFVHRRFAEYFVSQYFADNFHRENIQKIFFPDVLIKQNFSIIREFLNVNTKFLNKLGSKTPKMIEIIRIYSPDMQILYELFEDDLYNLFLKFLENLPENLAKNVICFNKNKYRVTVLHRICNSTTEKQILADILKAIKSRILSETLKELFFKKDNRKRTALHCINFYGKTSEVEQKLEFFKLNCTSKLFCELLLEVDEEKKTVLHLACASGKDITYLLDVSDENRHAISNLLLKTDRSKKTALFYTIEADNSSLLTKLLNLAKLVCNSEEIKTFFSIEINSLHLLHYACYKFNEDILEIFLNAIKDDEEMFQEFLMKTDKDNLSPLHYTVRDFRNFDKLKILLNFVNSNCRKTLSTLLCKQTRRRKTILHMAVEEFEEIYGQGSLTSLLTYLFNLVTDNKNIFNKLLLLRDENQRTVLYYTSSQSEYPFLKNELLDFVQTNCSVKILDELSCEIG